MIKLTAKASAEAIQSLLAKGMRPVAAGRDRVITMWIDNEDDEGLSFYERAAARRHIGREPKLAKVGVACNDGVTVIADAWIPADLSAD